MGLLDRLRGEDVSRVALIGIDGVPYTFLSSHFEEFEHLGSIAREGSAGAIESTVPPDSSACWPCLTTGQNPGKTGVYGFLDREIGSYDTYVPMGNDVQAERLWDRVHAAGREATVFNVPVTFPPQRTVQRMVSGFLSTDPDRAAHPEPVADYLDSIGYRIDVDATLGRTGEIEPFLENAHETMATRFEAFEHFLQQDDWDLFVGVFMTPDRVNHFLFDQYVDGGEHSEAFMEFYRTLDEYIGRIRDLLPDNVTLVVVSDHGFAKLDYEVNCNRWLETQGWFSFADDATYVLQVNHLLREEGLLSYVPDADSDGAPTPDGDLPLEIERIASIEASDFRGNDEPEGVFDETDVTDDSAAFAPDPETVLVFDDDAVDRVREVLTDVTDPEGQPLVETLQERSPPEGAVGAFDVTPAPHVRLGVDHGLSGEAVEPANDALADIGDDARAYSLLPGRFYLNLEGREPRGSVPASEYERVRDELRDALLDIDGPDGRPVCDRVLYREDVFRGDHDEIAPDLVAIPTEGYDLKAGFTRSEEVFTTTNRTGMHTFEDAALFVDDPDARIDDADLLDVAPTVLSLLDIDYERAAFDGASLL